ncbi:protein kinase A [Clonorchis sinensis]|uniref:Protein kinase A n=1 Tax=Clonorchis sinensis TaxID=79923 RepID=G7YU08_CLOSI|nr:protein kinase A [Clonorchis sinensis]
MEQAWNTRNSHRLFRSIRATGPRKPPVSEGIKEMPLLSCYMYFPRPIYDSQGQDFLADQLRRRSASMSDLNRHNQSYPTVSRHIRNRLGAGDQQDLAGMFNSDSRHRATSLLYPGPNSVEEDPFALNWLQPGSTGSLGRHWRPGATGMATHLQQCTELEFQSDRLSNGIARLIVQIWQRISKFRPQLNQFSIRAWILTALRMKLLESVLRIFNGTRKPYTAADSCGNQLSSIPRTTIQPKCADSAVNCNTAMKRYVTGSQFLVLRFLGKGTFGSVYLIRDRQSNELYALKSINKAILASRRQTVAAEREATVLCRIKSTFVIQLCATFEDAANIHMVLEYVAGCDLFELLRKHQRFYEPAAQFYAAQILMALDYLHSLKILYRDLKPENVMLCPNGYVKMVDFGLSKFVPRRTYTFCGTPEYIPPEMIMNLGYGQSADWWSFGVFLYEMLFGVTPFYAKNLRTMYERVACARYEFPPEPLITHAARELIRNLLEVDRSKRYGCLLRGTLDIKGHKFFAELHWDSLCALSLKPPYLIEAPNDPEGDPADRSRTAGESHGLISQSQSMELSALSGLSGVPEDAEHPHEEVSRDAKSQRRPTNIAQTIDVIEGKRSRVADDAGPYTLLRCVSGIWLRHP